MMLERLFYRWVKGERQKKVNLAGDIPARILTDYVDSYISIVTKILNASLE